MKVYVRQSIEKMIVDGKETFETTYGIGDPAGVNDLFRDSLFISSLRLCEKLYAEYQKETAKFYETHQSLIVELLAANEMTTQGMAKLDDFEDHAKVKGFMPRISVVYLTEDVGFDLGSRKGRRSGEILFQRPSGDLPEPDIKFENAPDAKILEGVLLKIGESISEHIENVILELCMALDIPPVLAAIIPEVHWVVCTEYPDKDLDALFPDKTQATFYFMF